MKYVIEYVKTGTVYPIYDLEDRTLVPSVLSAELTQAVNSGGLLTFAVTNDHPSKDALEVSLGEVRVYEDGICVLRADISSVQQDFDGTRTVTCEGIAARVLDVPILGWKLEGTYYKELIGGGSYRTVEINVSDPSTYLNQIFTDCLLTSRLLGVVRGTTIVYEPLNVLTSTVFANGQGTVYQAVKTVAEAAGGNVTYDYTEVLADKIKIHFHPLEDTSQAQTVELGVNLIGLEREYGVEAFCNAVFVTNNTEGATSSEQSYTGMYGITAPDGYTLTSGVLYDTASVAQYGMHLQTVATKTATRQEMLSQALQAITGASFYDRVSVNAFDLSGDSSGTEKNDKYNEAFKFTTNDAGVTTITASQYNYLVQCIAFSAGRYEVTVTDSSKYYMTVGTCTDTENVIFKNMRYMARTYVANFSEEDFSNREMCIICFQLYEWTGPGVAKLLKNSKDLVKFRKLNGPGTFELGTLLKLKSAPHGFPDYAEYPLKEIRRDLLSPEAVSLTLGQRTITLSGNVIYT